MIKRILIFIFTFLIAMSGFLTGFFSVGCMSVYAAVNDDSVYVPLREQSDLVKAFQSYCKSRDLTIEGSLTDAVTTFTTGAFNSACNEIGINITELQAEIKAEYDQSSEPVKFFFNDTGVMAMNRIFAQFLQDNELEVGDEDVNKTVFSGRYFTDDQGNTCLCYIIPNDNSDVVSPSELGTPYQFDADYLKVHTDFSQTNSYQNIQYTFTVNKQNQSVGYLVKGKTQNVTSTYNILTYRNSGNQYTGLGHYAIGFNTSNNKYYVGIYTYLSGSSAVNLFRPLFKIDTSNVLPAVNVVIISNQINNNNYEGDTYITNEGDVIYNIQPKDPNDTIHNVPETPLTPDGDGGWDIDLPDIDIPNLPIGNLSEKFPFSIPWDLVAFYAMLDAEPEAPRFNGTMDLTLVQWNYDIDLSPFDSAAELCRKLQFGLFVVGLIVASRSIIRG